MRTVFLISLFLLWCPLQDIEAQDVQPSVGDNESTALQEAIEHLEQSRETYSRFKRLSEKSTISQSHVRRAKFNHQIALLEVSSLQNPGRSAKNRLLKAELTLQFHTKELEIGIRLYQRRALSDVAYRRLVAAREVAKLNLQSLRSDVPVKQRMNLLLAAKTRYVLAEREHALAKQLVATGAISKEVFERTVDRLNTATEELAESKRFLGARAVQVNVER